jgi:hypothetical protein
MSLDDLKRQIERLSPDELARFRDWFYDFEWCKWDTQLERDVAAGNLDGLAEDALREHLAGKTKLL